MVSLLISKMVLVDSEQDIKRICIKGLNIYLDFGSEVCKYRIEFVKNINKGVDVFGEA